MASLAPQKPRLRIVAAVVAFMMAGCEHHGIVGKWRMSGNSGETVWEFSSNGSVLVGDVKGRYRFGDQDRIKIETPFATSVYVLEIADDHMTLREPGGVSLEFTRVTETKR